MPRHKIVRDWLKGLGAFVHRLIVGSGALIDAAHGECRCAPTPSATVVEVNERG